MPSEKWLPLSDPNHAKSCKVAALHDPLVALRSGPYADQVFGFWSLTIFVVTTADSFRARKEQPHHVDIVSLEKCFNPSEGEMVIVGSAASPGGNWYQGKQFGHWVRIGRWEYCQPVEAANVAERIIAEYFESDKQSF